MDSDLQPLVSMNLQETNSDGTAKEIHAELGPVEAEGQTIQDRDEGPHEASDSSKADVVEGVRPPSENGAMPVNRKAVEPEVLEQCLKQIKSGVA